MLLAMLPCQPWNQRQTNFSDPIFLTKLARRCPQNPTEPQRPSPKFISLQNSAYSAFSAVDLCKSTITHPPPVTSRKTSPEHQPRTHPSPTPPYSPSDLLASRVRSYSAAALPSSTNRSLSLRPPHPHPRSEPPAPFLRSIQAADPIAPIPAPSQSPPPSHSHSNPRQFFLGLIPISLRHFMRRTAIDRRQLDSALPHHLPRHRARPAEFSVMAPCFNGLFSCSVEQFGRPHFGACECASTNHSHLSMPREISVQRSAVPASSSSSASLIVPRMSCPKVESAFATASTCPGRPRAPAILLQLRPAGGHPRRPFGDPRPRPTARSARQSDPHSPPPPHSPCQTIHARR